jgi:hypothetical protein
MRHGALRRDAPGLKNRVVFRRVVRTFQGPKGVFMPDAKKPNILVIFGDDIG